MGCPESSSSFSYSTWVKSPAAPSGIPALHPTAVFVPLWNTELQRRLTGHRDGRKARLSGFSCLILRDTFGAKMSNLTRKLTPDRSKIELHDAEQVKYWTRALGVTKAELLEAIDKVGNAAAIVRSELKRRELAMSDEKHQPLKADDFPVDAQGKKIKKQDGTQIAEAEDSIVARDVADRLNEDEAQREEDKWSA